jgi:hypothetical protein
MQALDVKQVAATIRADVTAYIDGTGPDKETQHLELGRKVGLNEDVITTAWVDARKRKGVFISPSAQPDVESKEAELSRLADEITPPLAEPIVEKSLVEDLRAITDWTEFCQSTFAALASGKLTAEEAEGLIAEWDNGPEAWTDFVEQQNPTTPEPVEAELPKEAPINLPAIIPHAPPPVAPSYNDALEAMNQRHAIIDNVGSKSVIASWEPSSRDQSRLEVIFQNKESFLLRYSNRKIRAEHPDGQGGTIWLDQALGQWWLSHLRRRQHRGILFLPGGEAVVNDCLNLWQGWGCDARPGDWSLIDRHIVEVIAGGNPEFADYVRNWIAWSIQHPDVPAEVALVLIGRKGAGKGTLVRCLQRIFGAHTFQVTSREEVIGKFNGHLQDCILFVADEAYWGGDKRCVGRLQGMITETWLPIERKGIDLTQVLNRLHVIMLAEPGWVIPAGRFERRYAALAVDNNRQGDKAYFKALHNQIANGGAEAMFYALRDKDIGDFHPRNIPETLLRNPALQKQQIHTLPPMEQWYFTVLQDGKLPGALPKRPNTTYTSHLLTQAKERVPRLRYELSEVSLRNFLVDSEAIGITCTKYRNSIANGWSFPLLADCRAAWSTRYGSADWDLSEEWKAPSMISKIPKKD